LGTILNPCAGERDKYPVETIPSAFAAASGRRLVAFDADFRKYAGLAFLHLVA
jgi:hypothetical protein